MGRPQFKLARASAVKPRGECHSDSQATRATWGPSIPCHPQCEAVYLRLLALLRRTRLLTQEKAPKLPSQSAPLPPWSYQGDSETV